ncbi:hypothetical protein KSP40_PGU006073 [Platanthera guangdongensis]|uniref:ATP synthase F0 subunit 8 n=1 Tax=Platanthera guangdongensis TaxID=2320717 RepID=A0ABR2N253_9ASPA
MSHALNEVLIPDLNTFLWPIVMVMPLFGLFALLWKTTRAERQMQQWKRSARDAIESEAQTNTRARAYIKQMTMRGIWGKIVWMGKGKGPYIKKMVMSYIEEPECILCKSNSAHKIPSVCYFLNEAFDELEKHQKIYEDPKLYDFATLFLMIHANRILFMNVPTYKKASWLKERYIKIAC